MKKAVVIPLLLLLAIPLVLVVGCGTNADIHEAAESGDLDTVTQLLNKGEAVDKRNLDGNTPLLNSLIGYAFFIAKPNDPNQETKQKQNCKNIAVMLIGKGADVNAANESGMTPLYNAATIHDLELFKVLLSAPGASVNSLGMHGETPLHAAALEGNVEVVQYLLSSGANVNARSADGQTPLGVIEAFVAEEGEEGNDATVMRILREAGGTQ